MKTSNVVIGVTGAYILWLLFRKKATQPTNTGQQATETPSTAVSETNQQQYAQPTNNGSAAAASAAPAVDPVTVVDQIVTIPTTTTTTTATTERVIPEVQVHTFFPPVKPPVTVVIENVKKPDYSAVDIIEKVIATPAAPVTSKPVAASRSMAEKSPNLAAVSFAHQAGRIVARPYVNTLRHDSYYNGHRYWPNRVPKSI